MEEDKKPRKFYTAFVLFAQDGLTRKTLQLHCTHKYLGEQDQNSMGAVYRICNKFFEEKRIYPRAIFQERVEWVTGMQDSIPITTSVLKSFIHRDAFFPELRLQLEQFRKDDFEHLEYQPHITIDNYPSVTGQFQCFAIMSGETIITYWRNPEWDAMEKEAQRREKLKQAKKLHVVGR